MDKRVKKWLFDVSISIEEIEGYIDNVHGVKEAFVSNLMLCRAMERSFEIIGEALNRIAKENPTLEITDQSTISVCETSLLTDTMWFLMKSFGKPPLTICLN